MAKTLFVEDGNFECPRSHVSWIVITYNDSSDILDFRNRIVVMVVPVVVVYGTLKTVGSVIF
jgi:hypothetical protein